MLFALTNSLTKANSHSVTFEANERIKEHENRNARAQALAPEEHVADIQAQHDTALQRVVEGSVVGSVQWR